MGKGDLKESGPHPLLLRWMKGLLGTVPAYRRSSCTIHIRKGTANPVYHCGSRARERVLPGTRSPGQRPSS